MSIGVATYVSLIANVTLAVFAAGLVLLILWHDPHRRSNQYFGLCMAITALYGALNTAWQVPQQFDLKPEPLLYTVTTLYIGAIILLFNFVIAFAGVPNRARRIEHLVSIPLGVLFAVIVWTGRMYTDFEPLPAGGYRYALTPTGLIGVGTALLYLGASVLVSVRWHTPRARALVVPVSVLAVGVIGFAVLPAVRPYSFNAAAMAVAVIMLGRLVITVEVFQALDDLNRQLAEKNNELIEASQAKSRFLANMSHELRTPLNSIIGYTDMVINRSYGELTDLQADRLEKINRNGRRLLELINDVLDLSKIEAGRLDLRLARVPTTDLLNSLAEQFEPRAAEKGLALVRGYAGLPPLWVDEDRAHQILANLLSNAVKFTEKGVVIVRGHFDTARRQIVISVTDTGPGISPENQGRIFEAFLHADSLLSNQHEGTGLGLAIARRLVELHNGRIWFESTVGRGTTFHVTLPAAPEETVVQMPVIAPAAESSGPIILAIDDDCEALEVLQDHFVAAGFRVYGACSAADGLRLAHELTPALITLDVRMPGTDGWQVLSTLRSDPVTAAIPVLIISASDDHSQAQTAGADGFIIKPVQPQALLDQVRRLLAAASNPPEAAP